MKPRPLLLPALALLTVFVQSASRLPASSEPASPSPAPPAVSSPAPSAPAPSPAENGGQAKPDSGTPPKTNPPQPPETPAKPNTPVEPPRLFDGGVPTEAADFQGVIKGCVETIGQHKGSFRIKITCSQPNASSKARKPESLVSAVVLVMQGADKGTDGKWNVRPGHHEWVELLQPGSFVCVPVRYSKGLNGFRMTEVPSPPIPPESCNPAPAVAADNSAPKK